MAQPERQQQLPAADTDSDPDWDSEDEPAQDADWYSSCAIPIALVALCI